MSVTALRSTLLAAVIATGSACGPIEAGMDGGACGASNEICCYGTLCDNGLACVKQMCVATGSSSTSASGSSDTSAASSSATAAGSSSSGDRTTASSTGSTTSGTVTTPGSSGFSGGSTSSSGTGPSSTVGASGSTSNGTGSATTIGSGSSSGSSSGGSSTATSGTTSSGTGSSSGAGSSGAGASSGGELDGGAFVTIALAGCPYIGYSAPVTIEGQSFQLSVDTGSTDTGVALATCSNCGVVPEYAPIAGTCSGQTSSSYASGSWIAEVCSATVAVGAELPDVTIDLAGITSQSQFFIDFDCAGNPSNSQNEGILGLGPIDLDTIGTGSNDAYFNELVQQGVTDTLAVLLCSSDGALWFGGYDSQYASGPPQYTPMTASNYWAVDLSSIGFGAQNLGGGSSQSIIDTGTWGFYMASSAFNALSNAIASDNGTQIVFGSVGSTFFSRSSCLVPVGGQSQAQIDAALPPLTLTFPGVGGGTFTLSLPATQSYLLPIASGGTTVYCFGAADSNQLSGQTIIGAAALRTNITVFDEGNSQVGFVPQAFCR